MALQLFKIADVTVATPQANIEFTSIPQTYTDLKLVVSGRNTTGVEKFESVHLTFNNATSRYYEILLYNAGTSAGSASAQNTKTRSEWVAAICGNGATSNTFGNSETYITNYTSTNAKSVCGDWVSESNDTGPWLGLGVCLWNPTTNQAITSIEIAPNAGSFATNTTATLYGIL